MRTTRRSLRHWLGRAITFVVIAASVHYASDPYNYLYALETQRAKEAEVRAIAKKLNVDPEFLLHPQGRKSFDFKSLFAALGLAPKAAPQTNDVPLDVKESVARVKSRYALVAADTTLAKIAEAVREVGPAKNKGQMKAHLQSVLRLIDRDMLPPVPDAAPGSAKSRDAQMRAAINKLRNDVKQVLSANGALDEANIDNTLAQLRTVVNGTLAPKKHEPRWTKDPFPVKDTYANAPKKEIGSGDIGATSPAAVASVIAPKSAPQVAAAPLPAEITALANQLGTPAKIFAWVHDHIEWEAYSGVAKGSLGTLQEGRGNDWDQALLLRDLLSAKGYNAQLEWGTVTLPMRQAMNIAGTEDPTQAANLLATAGFSGIVLTVGSVPVGVQMKHAWVRALIPYIPNRGATAGTADTWVRMDPSFKRYEYQAGIKINGKVTWSEDEYLQTSAIRPPSDFYGDKIWDYIRHNNLDCQNLAQVAKTGRIKQENFPFVPSTLTAKIDSVDGSAVDAPADQYQTVSLSVANYTVRLADVWGKKLTITFAPATSDDAATINSYGGLFNTPAYLIKLKPVVALDDVQVAEGAPVNAGSDLDLNLGFHQPNVADDTTHHDMVAGETHTLVFDAGSFPDSLIESRINRLKTLTNEDQILSEKLNLVGLRYMQHVDDGIAFAAGVRWQRAVKRVFEADVRRQLDVSYTIAGAPLRLIPAENNIDVSRLLVGIVPIDNDLSNKAQALQLAGLQSSYLEGAIWEEMQSRQGVSAAKALLIARTNGQQLQTVTSSNVDAVLASANLSQDVEDEIRGAVAQGRIARIAPNNISVGHWTGTGYILEDLSTGAATYPISGGLAGGSETEDFLDGVRDMIGSEAWIDDSPLGRALHDFVTMFGEADDRTTRPSTTQSDPVNMATGNMFRSWTDFTIVARGLPIAVTRTYNSRSAYNGSFGYGWTWTYGETLTANADGSVTYRDADGTEHVFTNSGGTFVSPAGKHLTLTSTGAGYTLTSKEGMGETFDANGLLLTQSTPNGDAVTIVRDAAGNPQQVVDATGRAVLTIVTTGGRITQISDVGGRSATYAYSGAGDLLSVTDTNSKATTYEYDLQHNLTAFHDPLGNTQSYDYDTSDRLMHHVDAVGAEEFFQYDLGARQSILTDRRGGDRLIQYDDEGRATLSADAAGNVVKATFDADNNRTSLVDSRGNTTTYEFDANGNETKETTPDGGVITSTYDSQSRLLSTTDAVGVTTTNAYDSRGNLLESRRTVGGVTEVTTNTYDSHGQLLTTTTPNGGTTTMTWSSNGALDTKTDASNSTTTVTTDALGRITKLVDAAGGVTKLGYDGRDRILTMIDPYTNETDFTYDAAGRRTKIHSPRGDTTYEYDAEGRVTKVTNPLGLSKRFAYNDAGDVISRTDARGNTSTYEYDLIGRVTRMVDANGGVWTYGYCAAVGAGGTSCATCGASGGDPSGSFCELTDPNGSTIKKEFDVMGRVIAVTDSLAHATFYQYDKAGRKIAETDAAGNTTRYGYDEDGHLVTVREANGTVTTYGYTNGKLTSQRDPNGHVWNYAYDAMDRVSGETDPLGRTMSYTYDGLGNVKTRTDGNGKTTTYNYNVHRLMSTVYADNSTETYTYDAFGRRTGMSNASVSYTYTYDAFNQITSVKNNTYNVTISYAYDENGNLRQMTTPLGATTYTYDASNRLTRISDPKTGLFTFTYDPMGRRTSLTYPNGITTSYTYDKAYRLTSVAAKSLGTIVDAWSYQYDAVGNRVSKIDMAGLAETYAYDNLYRLTDVNYSDGTFEKFTYDAAGNRLSRTDGAGATAYSYDVANQLKTAGSDTFSYDGNGNLLTKTTSGGNTTFTYDLAGRATQIVAPDGTERSLYGPDGRRSDMSGASIENGQVRLIYDLQGNPIFDWGTDNQTWTYRLYGPGIDEPLAEWRRAQNRTTYLHHDAIGSVTAVSNTSGQVVYRSTYKAFGQMARTSYDLPTTRMGFTSRETSVGGQMNYRSRYYDPSTGRFDQRDEVRGKAISPPSLNRYVYTLDNPVRYIDPNGNTGAELVLTGLVFVAEALAGITLAELLWIIGLVVLVIIAIVAVVGAIVCFFNSNCRRRIKCMFGFVVRWFMCAMMENNEAHPLARARCWAICREKLGEWLIRCRAGNPQDMPWPYIRMRCWQPPDPPIIDDPGGDEAPFDEIEDELGQAA